MPDFINTYMPSILELERDDIYELRERLEDYFLNAFPDLETTPNTVLGDLILSPQAHIITAIEKGMERFMSDLDLGNVANGIIYNCDFVEQYIKNFVKDDGIYLRSSGVLRLVFTKNQRYTLDRSVRFSANDNIFSIYLPNPGPFTIYRPSEIVPPNCNGAVLHDSGSGTYFADVPVVGETGEVEVTIGTAGEISVDIPELGAVTALIPFSSGSEELSLSQLAKRARMTTYSASMNTRNGAIRYMHVMCPFIESIYAVHNLDREMLREFHNPYGVATGCLDVYVRSKGYSFTEVQTLTLYLNEEGTQYEGEFHYTGQPYHIESVTHPNIQQDNLPHTIVSTNGKGMGASAAYTVHEKLKLIIPEALNDRGESKYTPSIDENGRKSTQFTVTYQTDPLLPAIAQTAENNDNRPINTDILVRGFIPVIIDKFEVIYTRTPGVVPDLTTAKNEIKAYLGALGAPDVYSDAEIARIMQEAGAKYTKGVSVKARVQWSVGHKIEDYNGEIVDVPQQPEITASESLRVTYPPESMSLEPDAMFACSVRNIRYYLMENSLSFREVRDI